MSRGNSPRVRGPRRALACESGITLRQRVGGRQVEPVSKLAGGAELASSFVDLWGQRSRWHVRPPGGWEWRAGLDERHGGLGCRVCGSESLEVLVEVKCLGGSSGVSGWPTRCHSLDTDQNSCPYVNLWFYTPLKGFL